MELWKKVSPIYGEYEVSNFGRVRRAKPKRIKKPTVSKNGYFVVNLWKNNRGRVVCVHDLVAEAFIGPKPKSMCVNHIDGNKLNNVPDNLEYVTKAENTKHAWATGLCNARGENNGHAKLTESQALEIKRRALSGERTSDLAAEFGVGLSIVSQIKHGHRWKHLPM